MLGQRSPQRGFFDTDFLCGDRMPQNTFYAFLANSRDRLFADDDFSGMYRLDFGRPSVPPSILALTLLLQCHDKVSDREAWDRVEYDLRWSYALGIPSMEAPFGRSTLQLFRSKLILSGEAERVFKRSLEFASEEGFLKGRKLRVAVDTTPIFGAAAVKDTYNLLADGIRRVIRAVAVFELRTPEQWAADNGMGRYFESSIKGVSDVDWENEESRRAFLNGIVDDARTLVDWIDSMKEGEKHDRLVVAAEVLHELVSQDVEYDSQGAKLRQGVARDRVISAHDPEMRHGRKSARSRFDGYKAAIAVDVETGLITAMDVVPANTHDGDTGLTLVEATEEATGIAVEETIGDAAYGDYTTRQEFEQAERVLVAKTPSPQLNGRFNKQDFQVDLDEMTCICPAGHVTSQIKPAGFRRDRRGRRTPITLFQFDAEICNHCPLVTRCTKSNTGRTILIHPQEAQLQRARAMQRSPAFRPYATARQIAEHRNARLKQLGLRKARYVGRTRTKGQALITAAVANFTLVHYWRIALQGPANMPLAGSLA